MYVGVCMCTVPSWCNYLGRIRRCGLVDGGVPTGVGFEVSKARPGLCLQLVDRNASSHSSARPVWLHDPCHDSHELPSENVLLTNALFFSVSSQQSTVTKRSTKVEQVLPKVTILKRTLNLIDQILVKLSAKIMTFFLRVIFP